MKKIFYLLLTLTATLYSFNTQAQISDYEVCDVNGNGFALFDLTTKIDEILDGEDPSDYVITFHEIYDDAQSGANAVINPVYWNIEPYVQTIYVRIEDMNDGTFEVGSFNLLVYTLEIGIPDTLYSFDGVFDLTENTPLILNGSSDYSLTFHLTYTDAEQGIFAIVNPVNYMAISSPQTLYVRVESPNGCYVLTSFHLITGSDEIVYIPDAAFKTKLLQASISNQTAKDINGNNMVVDINDDGEIQVSEILNVYRLQVYQSNIEDLTGIEAFTNLIYLDCSGNNIQQLDLSSNVNLEVFWAIFNPQLGYLNVKSGSNLNPEFVDEGSWMEMWANLPNNIYICADESEIDLIEPYLNIWENTGQIISPYCTFYPAENHNTITGSLLFDLNNDGICDEQDIPQSFIKVNITDGLDQNSAFANEEGNYLFFTQDGEYTLIPQVENPGFFNIAPSSATVDFADVDNNEETVNFCITPNGVHPDLEVVIAPIIPARPGFEAIYKIVYRNKGNQIMSDNSGLMLLYDQNLMSFVSASIIPGTQNQGELIWGYENLFPFESREIVVAMQINAPTHPEYPVNIDDVLTFTSMIMPQDDDENVMDNTYIFNQTVVGAYDPNDIQCIEGDVIHPDYIGEELHYVIRFENTGNYYAENVVVAMEIDQEKYDVSSLRVLNSSHDVRAQVRGNMAEFFFNQIYLDSGGHGNILLVMNSDNSLYEGDFVQSKADIYFDYNYPVITNDAVTVFETTMSIGENIKGVELKFYPNPTTDYFNILSDSKIRSIELYDISGRLVRTSLVNDFETKQNISNLNNGIYILKIRTEKGDITGKIVKK